MLRDLSTCKLRGFLLQKFAFSVTSQPWEEMVKRDSACAGPEMDNISGDDFQAMVSEPADERWCSKLLTLLLHIRSHFVVHTLLTASDECNKQPGFQESKGSIERREMHLA